MRISNLISIYGPFLLNLPLTVVMIISAGGYGYLITRFMETDEEDSLGHSILAVGVGLCVFMFFCLVAGFVGLYKRPLIIFIVAAGLLFFPFRTFFSRRKVTGKQESSAVPFSHLIIIITVTVFWIVAGIGLIFPELFFDARYYQLGFPNLFLMKGTIYPEPHAAHSCFPYYINLLYGVGLSFGGPGMPKVIHFAFSIMCLALIFPMARLISGDNSSSGWFSLAIIGSVPGVAMMSAMAAIDMGVTLFAALGLYCLLQIQSEHPKRTWALLCGLFVGVAAGSKYTGVYLIPVFMVGIALVHPGDIKSKLRFILYFAGTAAIVAAPWYIRNWIVLGNPVYPALPSLFGSTPGSIEAFSYLARESGAGKYKITDVFRVLIDLYSKPESFGSAGSSPGIIMAFAPPVLLIALAGRHRLCAVAFMTLVYFFLWYPQSKILRFLYPAMLMAGLIMGALIAQIVKKYARLETILALLLAAGIAWNLKAVATFLPAFYWAGDLTAAKYLAGEFSRDTYLRKRLDYYAGAQFVNEHLSPQNNILMIGQTSGLYFQIPYRLSGAGDIHVMQPWLDKSKNVDELMATMRKNSITHIFFNFKEWERIKKPYGYLDLSQEKIEILREMFIKCREIYRERPVIVLELPNPD